MRLPPELKIPDQVREAIRTAGKTTIEQRFADFTSQALVNHAVHTITADAPAQVEMLRTLLRGAYDAGVTVGQGVQMGETIIGAIEVMSMRVGDDDEDHPPGGASRPQ